MSSHERGVLAATCVSSLGSFYTMAVVAFALPQIQRELSIPEDELGSLFALIRFGTLFALVIGVLADRMGRRRLLILSVAGCALCNLATAFTHSGLSLAGWQMGARLFMGGQILLAGVVVSEELSAENRGFGLGVLSAIGGLGGALTVLAFAFVEQLPYGWRFLFVLGSFGLLCVPWLWSRLSETRRFTQHQEDGGASVVGVAGWQPVRDILRSHGWRLAGLVGVVAPVTIILEPGSFFISKRLQDDLGYSPGEMGLMVAICGIGTPIGNMLAGVVSDRFGRRPVTIFMSLLLAVAVGLFHNFTTLVPVVVGLALIFVTLGGLLVLHTALATELFPTSFRSTAAGAREFITTLGASLGLWLVSLLFSAAGSNSQAITWLLVLTPISPLILFFMPETAGRELEESAAGGPVSDEVAGSSSP